MDGTLATPVTVYLVENSTLVRDRLQQLLAARAGVQVVGVAAGETEAVADLERLRPQVIILDLQLDQGSGLDVLRQTKQTGWAALVVVLTNHSSPQYRTKCLKAGADFFLDKSTEFERIVEILEQWRSGGAGS